MIIGPRRDGNIPVRRFRGVLNDPKSIPPLGVTEGPSQVPEPARRRKWESIATVSRPSTRERLVPRPRHDHRSSHPSNHLASIPSFDASEGLTERDEVAVGHKDRETVATEPRPTPRRRPTSRARPDPENTSRLDVPDSLPEGLGSAQRRRGGKSLDTEREISTSKRSASNVRGNSKSSLPFDVSNSLPERTKPTTRLRKQDTLIAEAEVLRKRRPTPSARSAQGSDVNTKKRTRRSRHDDSSRRASRVIHESVALLKIPPGSILVSIDCEAYEHNHAKITEIGIATLDTHRLVGIDPGDRGAYWTSFIRGHHAIIREHRHLKNKFTTARPDDFAFGKSVHIGTEEAATFTQNFFEHTSNRKKEWYKPRPIVLIGHALWNEKMFCKNYGFDLSAVSSVVQEIDTSTILERDTKTSIGLSKLLKLLDIKPNLLHNAGNDAYYTLMALVQIAAMTLEEYSDLIARLKASRLLAQLATKSLNPQETASGDDG